MCSSLLFQAIQKVLLEDVFPKHSLEEFYTVNVEKTLKEFSKGIEGSQSQVCMMTRFHFTFCTINIDR